VTLLSISFDTFSLLQLSDSIPSSSSWCFCHPISNSRFSLSRSLSFSLRLRNCPREKRKKWITFSTTKFTHRLPTWTIGTITVSHPFHWTISLPLPYPVCTMQGPPMKISMMFISLCRTGFSITSPARWRPCLESNHTASEVAPFASDSRTARQKRVVD